MNKERKFFFFELFKGKKEKLDELAYKHFLK